MDGLKEFTSCDISDALNMLGGKDLTGQLTDINLMTSTKPKIIGPAYTAEFGWAESKLPKPTVHHVDTIPEGSILVVKSPPEAINAVFGGLYRVLIE